MALPETLFIITRPPYEGVRAAELLDTLLVSAAFDLPLSVLFSGAGLWQLIGEQATAEPGIKSIVKQLRALPMYDVDRIFVHAPSMAAFNLSVDALALPATPLSDAAVRDLINGVQVVFSD